jgi:nucleotide-binding universal stress UspA family protein
VAQPDRASGSLERAAIYDARGLAQAGNEGGLLFGSIVVGTDGSDTAREAVRQATELAKTLGSRIYLVSAYEPVPEGRLREERQEVPEDLQWMVNPREDVNATLEETGKELKEMGLEVETHAREGDPADAILDVAEEKGADLIVVGNKGMTGAKRFLLGSVPNKVSHHAPCSVMIIRTT